MGDGRSFDQALRQLNKLIAEHAVNDEERQPDLDPVRRAYERIVSAATSPQR